MLFIFTLIGSVFGIEAFAVEPYGGASNEPSANCYYIPLFLAKSILMATIFGCKFSSLLSHELSIFSMMTVEMFFLIYLFAKRPYNSGLMNFGAIACELCAVYSLGIPVLMQFYTPTEEIDVLLLFSLQGLLVLAELITFIRIVKSYWNSLKFCC